MGSFLQSIFGNNPTLKHTIDQSGDIADTSANTGQVDTGAASSFYNGILSGDPSKIGEILAPQIKAGQDQLTQQANTTSQFGNRSGGNNSMINSGQSNERGNIINQIGQLQSGAAGNLANIGLTSTNQAQNSLNSEANMSQQQLQDMLNSILGKGITGGIGDLESQGISSLFSPKK